MSWFDSMRAPISIHLRYVGGNTATRKSVGKAAQMDWGHSIFDFLFIIIAFLAGAYAERRKTGGRCANTSTNTGMDAIAVLRQVSECLNANHSLFPGGSIHQSVNAVLAQLHHT